MILRTIDSFITEKDCKYLINLIKTNNQKSTVVSAEGNAYQSQSRNSSTCHLSNSDKIVKKLFNSISKELNLDKSLGEGLQGQLYQPGQYFKAHHDWFTEDDLHKYGKDTGNRTHTLMIYLNDTFEGGKTDFPKINFTATPKAGRAVTWNNLKSDGSGDEDALHEGMEVTKGKKYIITAWYRTGIPVEDRPTLTVVNNKKTFTDYEDFPKFTEKGFKVVDIPDDVWDHIQDMWTEVKELGPTEEEFVGKEHVITGGEKTSNLFTLEAIPQKRDMLFDMLRPLHEKFCGQTLDNAFIYGVRSYLEGADLKQHRDRIQTHHISSIILLEKDLNCGCKHKKYGDDWALDLQSHDGTWNKVYLEPKQILLYESAKCSHGRDERFQGTNYRNFYLHYTLSDYEYSTQ